jgi:hypothetical protein
MAIDLPPKLWTPPKPAIIRASDLPRTYAEAKKITTAHLPGFAALWGGATINPATVSYIGGRADPANSTNYSSFSNLDLSGHPNSHFLLILYGGTADVTRTFSTPTHTGFTFSAVSGTFVRVGGGGNILAMYLTTTAIASPTAAFSPTIGFSGGMANAAYQIYAIQNLPSTTPTDTGIDAGSTSNSTRTTSGTVVRNHRIAIIGSMSNTNTASVYTDSGGSHTPVQDEGVNVEGTVNLRCCHYETGGGGNAGNVSVTNAYFMTAACWTRT